MSWTASTTHWAVICFTLAGADSSEAAAGQLQADKRALAALQVYVGGWRGVGQVRRGSNQGAWQESVDWAWSFAKGRASLVFEAPKGKYYQSGRLMAGAKPGEFELLARRAGSQAEDRFRGSVDDKNQLVLFADPTSGAGESNDRPSRVSLRTVADGDRLIVLYEKRLPGSDRFTRLGEVGFTRIGSSFAKGSSQPQCVVTGGLGTIEVHHQGKTYLVCCTGCRDLFNDDPEGVLADYQERKAKERAEQAKKE